MLRRKHDCAVFKNDRDMLVERTQSGLARAKAQGKTLGRSTSTTPERRALMMRHHQAGDSISALARAHKISRASVMRIVKPATTIQSMKPQHRTDKSATPRRFGHDLVE
jgi:DNA invertase Pin-like site-specific DNA recombinase